MEPTHYESLFPNTTRFGEIEKIMSFVKEGNSCELVGLPGSGMSNLIGLLSYNKAVRLKHLGDNQKWFHFVPADFTEMRNRPLSDAIKFLFLTLSDSLRQRNLTQEFKTVSAIFRASLNLKDELVLFQGLKRAIDYLSIEKELTVVFLFDRFDEYIPMLTPEFFADLRILRNRAKYRFSVVFSLYRPLEDIIEPSLFSDFHEFIAGHTIYMSLFDMPGHEFRKSYLEKVTGKNISRNVSSEIIRLTAGHAKLSKLAIEAVLGHQETIQRSNPLLKFLLSQKTLVGALFEIWRALRPSEQNAILHTNFTNDHIHLEKIHLVKGKKIAIPLFQEFVSAIVSTQREKDVHISLDPRTGDVLQGSTPISDELTTSEFRLIQFLLQNPDKILTRQEIIDAVWHDAKTTAGVTDQALDQLVFRLRRKIETDPNTPTHLQTVKGIGFRFYP